MSIVTKKKLKFRKVWRNMGYKLEILLGVLIFILGGIGKFEEMKIEWYYQSKYRGESNKKQLSEWFF